MDLQERKGQLIIKYDTIKVIQLTLQLICCAVALIRGTEEYFYLWVFVPNAILTVLNTILLVQQCQLSEKSKLLEAYMLKVQLVIFVLIFLSSMCYFALSPRKPNIGTDIIETEEANDTSHEFAPTDSDQTYTDPHSTKADWSTFIGEFLNPYGPFAGFKLDKYVGFPVFYGVVFTAVTVIVEFAAYHVIKKLEIVQIEIDKEINKEMASYNPVTRYEWIPPEEPDFVDPLLDSRPSVRASDERRREENVPLLEEKKEEETSEANLDSTLRWEKYGQY